jgi:hypothetical protein
MYWDTNIESEIQNPITNKLGFSLSIPSKTQFLEILSLTDDKGTHNSCDFLVTTKPEHYKKFSNVVGGTKNAGLEGADMQIYIITHSRMYSIYNGQIYYHVLGVFMLNFLNGLTFHYNNKGFVTLHVESRCSFGNWPKFKGPLKKLSEKLKQKINIGKIISIYIDSIGRRYAYEKGANSCVLFNASLTDAIDHHLSNGWSAGAQFVLNKLSYGKYKGQPNYTALTDAVNMGVVEQEIFDPNSEHMTYMYKTLKP